MAKARPVSLPPDIRNLLTRFSKSRSLPTAITLRSKILLMCAEGYSNKQIAGDLNVTPNTVSTWRNRFINESSMFDELIQSKDQDSASELKDALESFLEDRPRSGKPPKFTEAQVIGVQRLACEHPQDHGIEASQWSLNQLKSEAERIGLVDSISAATIRNFLKSGKIQPHRSRYWLNSPDKKDNPEKFHQIVTEICNLYHSAAEEMAQHNHYIVSGDEMTGVQALERISPDKPTAPSRPAYHEFEYKRHGTLSSINFMNVANGTIYPPYINKTRNEMDFTWAVSQVVQHDPKASWTFVVDGLNTHKSASLVKYVARECGIHEDLGKKGVSGILKNMITRTEFLMNPEHRIRFVYTPRHCSWMNMIEIWFSTLSRKLLKKGTFKSLKNLENRIRNFVKQYNITAKPYKWNYRGSLAKS